MVSIFILPFHNNLLRAELNNMRQNSKQNRDGDLLPHRAYNSERESNDKTRIYSQRLNKALKKRIKTFQGFRGSNSRGN
jgi:hypothetical protein